jgi:inosine-uridine nucleoside N-ribohydrolase
MNVIFDCDNTFGVAGCDVDDGLALLYLLGSGKANLLGITNTYGNSDIDTVYKATRRMLEEIGRTDIPQMKGGAKAGEVQSEAVDFLVDTASRHAGDISILATGSLTNLLGACHKDAEFFDKVNRVCLMGGLTETLFLNGTVLDELNFSCDPEATLQVLTGAKRIEVATGNNCLGAYFSREGYERRLVGSAGPIARYLYEKTAYWYEYNMKSYGLDGFYNWDVTAAAYLLDPELFEKNETVITPDLDSLKRGFLNGGGRPVKADLPKIRDPRVFEDHIYNTYFNVKGAL